MKYTLDYYVGMPMDKADEIIINGHKPTAELLDFIEKHIDKGIVLNLTRLDNLVIKEYLPIIAKAAARKKDFKVMITSANQMSLIPTFYEENIPYFFSDPIYTWDILKYCIDNKVSDVIISGELGFNLRDVRDFCNKKNVSIRVMLNVAQPSVLGSPFVNDVAIFKSFFIRPEDVPVYEPYIDYALFQGDPKVQAQMLDIYKGGRWENNLNLIIAGGYFSIDNQTIVPTFGKLRCNCKKRCNQEKCNICDSIYSMGRTMADKGCVFSQEGLILPEDKAKTP